MISYITSNLFIWMHCCGMSMLLTNKPCLNSFLVKSKPIEASRFYYLLIIVFIGSMINELLINYSYSVEVKEKLTVMDTIIIVFSTLTTFVMSWSLMMLSMTANVWILVVMIGGRLIMKMMCIGMIKTKKRSCCI